MLVGRALRLLDPQPRERVIDWFCGLGNFTLPLATRARAVLGIEGSAALVERAARDAALRTASPSGRAFVARDLFELTPAELARLGPADKWLLDPPREGAFAIAKALAELHAERAARAGFAPPQRIVYVSCNPATLARDAGLLVHQAGYRCAAAGAVTCSRTPRTSRASRSSSGAWQRNGARRPRSIERTAIALSRVPPAMPRIDSSAGNTLYRLM